MRRSHQTSRRVRVLTMKSLKDTVANELEIVRKELASDESNQDREALEGWKQALKWVLQEIEKGGQK